MLLRGPRYCVRPLPFGTRPLELRSFTVATSIRKSRLGTAVCAPRAVQTSRPAVALRWFSDQNSLPDRKEIAEAAKQFLREHRLPIEKKVQATKSTWQRIVSTYRWAHDFSLKFWQGTKDLYRNTLEARRLSKLKKAGQEITRQQDRFIRQNHKDLRSLLPFFLVWRIPLIGDFVLPIFIAKFPALLPSTFKLSKHLTPEDRARLANIKQISILRAQPGSAWWPQPLHLFRTPCPAIEPLVVKLLHDTIEVNRPSISSERILDNSSVLETNFRLKDLSFKQAASLAAILGLGTRVPLSWLVRRIERHVDYLLEDDKLILREGPPTLSDVELREAVFDRGLKMLGLSRPQLLAELAEWFNISQTRPQALLPLLIYAHAFDHRELWLQSEHHWDPSSAALRTAEQPGAVAS